MKKLIWIIYSWVAVIVSGCNNPDRERTSGKNQAEMQAYLSSHLITVMPDANNVRFVTDGVVGVGSWQSTWSSEFSLPIGATFQSQPDHHASSSFEVRGIHPTSVAIRYQTQFDHRSFGKNLISIDEGEIEILYR